MALLVYTGKQVRCWCCGQDKGLGAGFYPFKVDGKNVLLCSRCLKIARRLKNGETGITITIDPLHVC